MFATPIGRMLFGRKAIIFADDFSSYADSTALQAAWTGAGGTPLVTLAASPSRMRVENGAAATSYAYRIIATVPGKTYRLSGNVIAKGANVPRVFVGISANGATLGTYVATAVGLFTLVFTATTATTFLHASTLSVTTGHFVEVDDLLITG